MPAQTTTSPGTTVRSATRPHRGKANRRILRLRWILTDIARPNGAQITRELFCCFIARTHKLEYLASFPTSDLDYDICRCTEAKYTEATRISCHPQGQVADQTGT